MASRSPRQPRSRRSQSQTVVVLLAAILLVLIVIAVGVIALTQSPANVAATRTVDWTQAGVALDHYWATQTAEHKP